MNIFRLTGDLSHLLAILVLLWKIWKTRSCAGKFLSVVLCETIIAPIFTANCLSVFLSKDILAIGVPAVVFVVVISLNSGLMRSNSAIKHLGRCLAYEGLLTRFCTRVTTVRLMFTCL